MDSSAIRKVNLRRLIDKEGSVKAVAEKGETDPSYLSSVLSGKGSRNPGATLMRKLETAYNLERGSLDLPEPVAINVAMVVQMMPDEQKLEYLDYALFKAESMPPPVAEQARAQYLAFVDKLRQDVQALRAREQNKKDKKPS